MTKPTFASLFSGGGLADCGAVAAGCELAFAVEADPQIADVYRANHGDHVIVAGVQDVNLAKLPPVDILWASPPCQAHSVARSKKLAARDDAEVGIILLDYVRACQPRVVIVENVEGYAKHPVFVRIVNGLMAAGYWCQWSVLNSADVGAPQTRRRLILRAVRDALVPMLPAPMRRLAMIEHERQPAIGMRMCLTAGDLAEQPAEIVAVVPLQSGDYLLSVRYATCPPKRATIRDDGAYFTEAFWSCVRVLS